MKVTKTIITCALLASLTACGGSKIDGTSRQSAKDSISIINTELDKAGRDALKRAFMDLQSACYSKSIPEIKEADCSGSSGLRRFSHNKTASEIIDDSIRFTELVDAERNK
jgi:hypothetical protein